jgi:hypothetical protein
MKFSAKQKMKKNSPFNIWQSQIFHMRKRISQQSYFTRRKANFIKKSTSNEVLFSGAGDGNRTHTASLEGWNSSH